MARHSYLFDVKLFATFRIEADTEAEARQALLEALDCASVNAGEALGQTLVGEASVDGDLDLLEVDGEAASAMTDIIDTIREAIRAAHAMPGRRVHLILLDEADRRMLHHAWSALQGAPLRPWPLGAPTQMYGVEIAAAAYLSGSCLICTGEGDSPTKRPLGRQHGAGDPS